ncbi:MAG TPA: hypothetical protein VFU37_17145 [Pyrinomonadaceae bacterium]|nr:hypothetical protein [Pyrinomonadaceae bacterium]
MNPIGHSVGQRFNVPSAVHGHERLHSSTYNQAGVFLFHDFRKRTGAATIFDWGVWNRLLERIAFRLILTRIGTLSELNVTCKFKLSPLETYHAPPLKRINSRTAFAAFSNGGAAAIIITQNTTASQAKC